MANERTVDRMETSAATQPPRTRSPLECPARPILTALQLLLSDPGHVKSTALSVGNGSAVLRHWMTALDTQQGVLAERVESLWQQLLDIAHQVLIVKQSPSGTQQSKLGLSGRAAALHRLLDMCDALGAKLVQIDSWVQEVSFNLALMAWELDGGVKHATEPLSDLLPLDYKRHVQELLSASHPPDVLLLGLSDCYAAARGVLEGMISNAHTSQERAQHWRPPDEFRRNTTKYWVLAEDVPRIQSTIIRHLPLLVVGRAEGALLDYLQAAPMMSRPASLQAYVSQLRAQDKQAASPITSIYYDSFTAHRPETRHTANANGCLGKPQVAHSDLAASSAAAAKAAHEVGRKQWPLASHCPIGDKLLAAPLPVYHTRMHREDGSSLMRVRWYGEGRPADNAKVFWERKLHRESWTGDSSTKERVPLQLHQLPAALAGAELPLAVHPAPKPLTAAQQSLLQEMQQTMYALQQEPLLRTVYNRVAFQSADSNAVRISMDMDVIMTREIVPPGAEPWSTPWAVGHSLHSSLTAEGGKIGVLFPYAILEIKLQDKENIPEWLKDLKRSGLLLEAPKFSKVMHGTALLYPHLVRNTPHWFLPEVATAADGSTVVCMKPVIIPELLAARDLEKNKATTTWLPGDLTSASGASGDGGKGGVVLPPGACVDHTCAGCAAVCTTRPDEGAITTPQLHTCALGRALKLASTLTVAPEVADTTHASARQALLASAPMIHSSPTISTSGGLWSGTQRATSSSMGNNSGELTRVVPPSSCDMLVCMNSPQKAYAAALPHSDKPSHAVVAVDAKLGTKQIVHEAPAAAGQGVPKAKRVWRKLRMLGRKPAPSQADIEEGGAGSGYPRAKNLVHSRVEPKTFFAAERTFLAWINLAVLLMFVALSMLTSAAAFASTTTTHSSTSTSGGNTTGTQGGGFLGVCAPGSVTCIASLAASIAAAPAALTFMLYALYMYRLRTKQILRREAARYDDQRGPLMLVFALAIVLAVSYILTVVAPMI